MTNSTSKVNSERAFTVKMNLDPFNDWGARDCNKFVPALGGNGTKIAPTGDIFDQPPGQCDEFGASLPTR